MFISNGSIVTTKVSDTITPFSLTGPIPGRSSGKWPSAYSGIYQRQLWPYVVVNKLARATARLPFPVYERGEKGRTKRPDHPMAQLLQNPNQAMSGYQLWLWTSSMRDIFGEAVWFKQRTGGRVAGLYPLHPSAMSVGDSGAWSFDNGKFRMTDIDDTDLVWFNHFNPESMTRGLSPLEPLRSTLENEWSARTATSSFWQRGARPGTALVHPKTLSQPAQDRLKAQMDSISAGADKTGVTVVLEEGMEPKTLQLTAEEAQYIETRKLNREEVCAAYDVPPPVVHILDRATFSNISEQLRSMYRDTMGGILPGFEAVVDLEIRQAEFPNDDIYAEFLMDEVLRGDFETRQAALKNADHMTIAEKRAVENLPFVEGTDRIFLNAAVQPMTAPQNDDAPAAPPFAQVGLPALIDSEVISRDEARELLGISGEAPEPTALPAAEVPVSAIRAAMGRLSWQQALPDVVAKDVVEGLDPSDGAAIGAVITSKQSTGGTVAELRAQIRALPIKSEED